MKEAIIRNLLITIFNGAMVALIAWMWMRPSFRAAFREWWNTYEPSAECEALRLEMQERGIID